MIPTTRKRVRYVINLLSIGFYLPMYAICTAAVSITPSYIRSFLIVKVYIGEVNLIQYRRLGYLFLHHSFHNILKEALLMQKRLPNFYKSADNSKIRSVNPTDHSRWYLLGYQHLYKGCIRIRESR